MASPPTADCNSKGEAVYVGWDWASRNHDLTVIDHAGALLESHWPGANAIFSRLGSAIALAFLADYPTPQSAARLGAERLAMFCRRHSYRGGRSPAELLGRLRDAPVAPVGLDPIVLTEL